jgi:hypothetical protein
MEINMISERMFFLLILLFLLTSCQNKQSSGNFWQGTWTVTYNEMGSNEKILAGYLLLEEDRFHFTATRPDSVIQILNRRLPFIDNTSGTINIEIKLDDKQSFSSVESGTTLALLTFEHDSENFQIRMDQSESKLFLHGEFSEFQFWSIEKGLSD